MALGDKLGADHNIEVAARDRLDFGAQTLRAAREIRRKGQYPCTRKKRCGFFGQSLDAGTACGKAILRLADRANRGSAFEMAAMMAHQGAAETVLDEPGGAVRALKRCPQARQSVKGA